MKLNAPLLILFLSINGCATSTENLNAQPEKPIQSSIAREFSRVIAQIPSLSPTLTTLSMVQGNTDSADFGEQLQAALVEEGFALRFIDKEQATRFNDQDQATNVVDYTVENNSFPESSVSSGSIITYEISVDNVGLRRHYALQADGLILPVDSMQVRGMNPELIALEDDDFAIGQGTSKASVSDNDRPATFDFLDDTLLPRVSASTLEKKYLHSGQSAYGQVLARTTVVDDMIIKFPDYSKVLGRQAREKMRTMMKQFDPATDIISIAATSQGRGKFPGDQKDLAWGRADQVRKVLKTLGVQTASIHIEADAAREMGHRRLSQEVTTVAIRRKNSIWQ